jgi:rhodanese-related sulfurtransferase
MGIKTVDATVAKQWLENGEAVLVDVREPGEHASCSIDGATLLPSGAVCCAALPVSGEKKIIIHCQKGMRGVKACEKLQAEHAQADIYNMEGGIEAWEKAGFAVKRSGRKVLPLDRQVQSIVGSSVLIFSLLAYLVNPAFALGAAFFGAGLANAGFTGWCGLARLLVKMPWNR